MDHKEEEEKDRISKLPDHVLHHILSLLPSIEVVFRTSLLSKRWKTLWINIPLLNFKRLKQLETYLNTQKSVANYSHGNSIIARFMFYRNYKDNHNVGTIKDLLNSFLETNTVKELDLTILSDYILTKSVLNNLASSSSLTFLKLEGMRLILCKPNFHPIIFPSLKTLSLKFLWFEGGTNFPISFPSLTTLYLKQMYMEEELYQNIISQCPIIENLHCCEIDFSFGLDLSVCRALRNLYLDSIKLSDQLLEHLVSGIPLLENLSLRGCNGLNQFNIHSKTLKAFCCINGGKIAPNGFTSFHGMVANFSTPNLVEFGYKGRVSSIFSIYSLNRFEASVVVVNQDYGQSWYSDLLMLLSNLKCSNTLALSVPFLKALLIPKPMRGRSSPLPDLKHLKVWTKKEHEKSEFKEALLRNSLHWCAPSLEILEINYC